MRTISRLESTNLSGPPPPPDRTEFIGYFDDSGHPDQSAVSVGGFVAEKARWLQFDEAWRGTLGYFGIAWFHMADFEAGRGPFRGWGTRRKDKLLNRLIEIVRSHAAADFSQIVPMDDYHAVNELYALEEYLGTPYAMAGRGLIRLLNNWQSRQSEHDHARSLNFDDGTKHKGDLIDIYQRDRIPLPGFLDKKQTPALQAADLLAWETLHAFKIGRVRRSLDRLVSSVEQRHRFHGIFDKPALVAACKSLPVPLRTSFSPIAFHSSPKKGRVRTIHSKKREMGRDRQSQRS